MYEYKQLIKRVRENGEFVDSRNGKTLEVFGESLKVGPLHFNNRFPIVTERKMHYKGVLGELAAFLQGPKHITDFRKQGCNFWDQWADANGDINVDYGNAWQDFLGINQLQKIVRQLQYEPQSRRHLIIGWNPANLEDLSLPCCHYAYQWNVSADGYLDMLWIQRSADVMIGLPSDIIAGAAWNILMAHTVGLVPRYVTFQLGSTHIYADHLPLVDEFLKCHSYSPPTWHLNSETDVFTFKPEDLTLSNYQHGPSINFELKV